MNWLLAFLMLPFWEQFLIVAAAFIPGNFLMILVLEIGPMASASPCSGGFGFIITGIVEMTVAIVAGIAGGAWQPLYFLAAPFIGYLGLMALIILFASFFQNFGHALARRRGLRP